LRHRPCFITVLILSSFHISFQNKVLYSCNGLTLVCEMKRGGRCISQEMKCFYLLFSLDPSLIYFKYIFVLNGKLHENFNPNLAGRVLHTTYCQLHHYYTDVFPSTYKCLVYPALKLRIFFNKCKPKDQLC